jgi:hypothetical protein
LGKLLPISRSELDFGAKPPSHREAVFSQIKAIIIVRGGYRAQTVYCAPTGRGRLTILPGTALLGRFVPGFYAFGLSGREPREQRFLRDESFGLGGLFGKKFESPYLDLYSAALVQPPPRALMSWTVAMRRWPVSWARMRWEARVARFGRRLPDNYFFPARLSETVERV